MTTTEHQPVPTVTDEHRRLASQLLSPDLTIGRTVLAEAIAAAEQRGRAAIAATITLHAKDAGEASAIYAAQVSVLAGRRDVRSRAAAAEAAVRAGQASAVQQALRGVLSA